MRSVEEKFQDYRWIPLEPELIDYAHAQFVLIGHTHREPGQDLKQMEEQNETRVEEHGQGQSIPEKTENGPNQLHICRRHHHLSRPGSPRERIPSSANHVESLNPTLRLNP